MPRNAPKLPDDLEEMDKVCRSKGYHIVKIRAPAARKPVAKEGVLYDGSVFSIYPDGMYNSDDPNFVTDKVTDVKLLRKLGFVN